MRDGPLARDGPLVVLLHGFPEFWYGWRQRDRCLGPKLAEPHHENVPNLDRVERLPDASHWVHHDEAEHVNELLVDFLAPGSGSHTAA